MMRNAGLIVLILLSASFSDPASAGPEVKSVFDLGDKKVSTAEEWPAARAKILDQWKEVIGPFPERTALKIQTLSTEQLPDHTRLLVRYQADPINTADAYILIPKDAKPDHSRRGAVVLHQTSDTSLKDPVGLGGRETMHMALHLVRRGYVCIAPQNYLWGAGDKPIQGVTDVLLRQKPWKTGMAKMTWDAIRATDVLLERPEVDPKKLCSIGHSLGGKEVIYHAAFDDRIKASVSCEGGIGLAFSNWDADWYLGKQIKQPGFKHDQHEVIALIAPRSFLLIGGDSADGKMSAPYIEANKELWKLLGGGDLKLIVHAHGHDFLPPGEEREQVYEWLDAQLKGS